MRCSSTGRKCDGYEGLSLQSRLRDSRHRLPSYTPTSLGHSKNDRETRSFQYFYERTVPSLAGYCGSEFWNQLILQVSQHEKSVWHALVALGALHENFEKDEHVATMQLTRRKQDSFAIKEYVAAIRALLDLSDGSSRDASARAFSSTSNNLTVDVCLISCILFVCFETLSGHYVSAINHIRSGSRILGEVYYDPSSGTYQHPCLKPSTVTMLEMENLRKIFLRLQGQTLTLTRVEPAKPFFDTSTEQSSNSQAEVPECFSSIAEARDFFEYQGRRCAHGYHSAVSAATPAEVSNVSDCLLQQYESLFRMWTLALDRFEQSRGQNLTRKESLGLRILRIYRYRQILLLAYGRFRMTDVFDWDEYNPLFEEIVSLASSVAQTRYDADSAFPILNSLEEGRGGEGIHLKPSFTLDNGIIAPLYDVATLCRDPIIRRKAVQVLRSTFRQEGVFNSQVTAMAAEKVIAIEEAAASKLCLDYRDDVSSLATIVSDTKQEEQDYQIKRSSQVPQTVRLTYAYPRFDTIKRKIFLTIGQETNKIKMHLNIPFPAASAMLDMEFNSIL